MRKIALFCAVAGVALGALASDGLKLKFSSTGPDKYADGSVVLDGEVYALVWVKDGAQFGGINADGTLVDPTNNALLLAAPMARNGRCPTVVFIVDEKDAKEGGSYQVFLLDTRVSKADAEGNVTTSLAGLSSDGTPKAVKASALVAEASQNLADAVSAAAAGGAGMSAASLPANVPTPEISAFRVEGSKVIVEVTGTVPYLQYTVSGGKTPASIDQSDLASALNGDADGITLYVNDPAENRFFKVIQK